MCVSCNFYIFYILLFFLHLFLILLCFHVLIYFGVFTFFLIQILMCAHVFVVDVFSMFLCIVFEGVWYMLGTFLYMFICCSNFGCVSHVFDCLHRFHDNWLDCGPLAKNCGPISGQIASFAWALCNTFDRKRSTQTEGKCSEGNMPPLSGQIWRGVDIL